MTLVYQAYGRIDILHQTVFSVASLLKVSKPGTPLKILVYTDNKKLFTDFFGSHPMISYVEVTSEQIQRWRGAINFVHRVKVEILIDAAQKVSGALFYVDGDTYFREDPTALFSQVNDQRSLMHISETKLSEGRDPLSKKINKFVKSHSFQISGEKVQILSEHSMWNAGALGLSEKNRKFLPLVLRLTDQMFVAYSKHVMEQLAFSYYLQTRTQIFAADHVIGHYWNQKEDFQVAIDQFLKTYPTWLQAEKAYGQFPWPQAPLPKVKKSFWSQIFAKNM